MISTNGGDGVHERNVSYLRKLQREVGPRVEKAERYVLRIQVDIQQTHRRPRAAAQRKRPDRGHVPGYSTNAAIANRS